MGRDTLSHAKLVDEVCRRAHIDRHVVGDVLSSFREVVEDQLKEGGAVRLRNFGTFEARALKCRQYTMPSGEAVKRPPGRVVGKFRPSETLNKRLSVDGAWDTAK